jgi:hypothetical protein
LIVCALGDQAMGKHGDSLAVMSVEVGHGQPPALAGESGHTLTDHQRGVRPHVLLAGAFAFTAG